MAIDNPPSASSTSTPSAAVQGAFPGSSASVDSQNTPTQDQSGFQESDRPAKGLRRPSLVHLASHGSLVNGQVSRSSTRPSFNTYDSFLRSLPDSAISNARARHADFSRPIGVSPSTQSYRQVKRSGAGGGSEAASSHWRARSASISSLNSVLSGSSKAGSISASSASRKGKAREADDDSVRSAPGAETESAPSQEADKGPTSWKSWFLSVKSPGIEEEANHDADRGFLSLFAGTGAVDEAKQHASQTKASEEAESQMLSAPLPVLSDIASYLSRSPSSNPKDSDQASEALQDTQTNGKTATKRPTFLSSSIFSSTSANPLQSPASMLSSLSLNPFAIKNPDAYKTPARGYSQDHHPKRDVEEYLDEQDTQASKAEDDAHMDRYALIKERYNCPKYPLIFCHGLFGFDTIGPSVARIHYWIGVKEALESIGAEVLITKVPTSASIEERAKVLCETIEKEYAGREVNLIGHSMGGLDGRFLITHLQPTTFKVRSLTTITSPHRGSAFADYMLEEVIGNDNMPALLRLVETLGIPGGGRAFDNLTTTKMARFNDETPDREDVKYFSYGAEFKPGWSNVFRLPWSVIYEREGDNDGLVSVESAKHGHYQGTLTNVSHLDVIGFTGPIRFNWASLIGKPIKFKPVSFFLSMAEMLADNDL